MFIFVMVSVTSHLVASMQMAKVFKPPVHAHSHSSPQFAATSQYVVNALDFHAAADVLVASRDDDTIRIYNTNTGNFVAELGLKKYGCSLVRFTHHHASVLHASNKEVGGDTEAVEKSHALRYLSLHDNQYLQYFYGHVQKVTSLDMAPMNDLFMSSSEDRSVRLWDLRKNKSVDVIATGPHPVAAYDKQGLVFAVGGPGGNVKLYDVRSYKKPFAVFQVPADRLQTVNAMAWGVTPDNVPCTRVKFSMDGKALLLSFDGAWVMLDAYEGKVKAAASTRGENDDMSPGSALTEASLSPDGKYVVAGCADRRIRAWSHDNADPMQPLQPFATFDGHAGVPRCVKWAPRRLLMASACSAVALWLPWHVPNS